MPYYLVPMVEIGPSLYRPGRMRTQALGLEQKGANCVRLGPDQAVIWTPDPILDPRAIELGAGKAEVAKAAGRVRLQELATDRPLRASATVSELVADLLKNPPLGAKWGPLKPTREGNLEIWLGPPTDKLLHSEKVAPKGPNSKDIQDDFNRTGNLDGSTTSDAQTTWVEDAGTGWLTSVSVASVTGNVVWCVGRLALAMDTADHYAQIDITTFTRLSAFLAVGVAVRINATPTSGYGFEVSTGAGGSTRRVYDFVSDANIASDTTAPATGLLYLELNGSTYTAKIAGTTVFTGTDTTYDGTVKGVGISAYSDGSGNSTAVTSFRGADLAGGGDEPRQGRMSLLGVGI